jgi:hypothetical protein
MVIINTTFHVEKSVEQQFLSWINQIYKTKAIETGLFSNPVLAKVLADVDPNAEAYAFQMKAEALDKAQNWHDQDATALRQDMFNRWGEKVLFFTTYLDIVE